jgi:hypothetical protein
MLNCRICSSVRHWLVAIAIFFAILKPAYSESDEVTSAFDYCSAYKTTLKFSGDPLVIYKSTVKLSDDQTVLCFDGPINSSQDMSDFHALKPNGLLVMRSPGGYAHTAMILSNILRDKAATVVLHEYCLSACANHVFVATHKTYVKKNTIVAWHGGPSKRLSEYDCTGSGRERLFEKYHAPGGADTACQTKKLYQEFFKQRGIDDRHIDAPQTFYTKKMVRFAAKEEADKRRIFWMWNPQNYGDYFKSNIAYESYPTSQDEVDSIAARLRLRMRVFYDP